MSFKEAILNGDLDLVKDRINHGDILSINLPLIDSRTEMQAISTLHYAVACGQFEIVRFLLDSGVYVDCKSSENYTPLCIAIYQIIHSKLNKQTMFQIIELLVSRGAEINYVINRPNMDILPQHKVLSSFRRNAKKGILHIAVENKREDLISLLIDLGADININILGVTPLFVAVECRSYSMINLLLDKGASIEILEDRGYKLLSKALNEKFSDVDVVKRLVMIFNNLNLNKEKYDILHKAVCFRNIEILKLLLDGGVYIDTLDEEERTPLHRTVEFGINIENLKLAQFLISNGASVNAKTSVGHSILHTAAVLGSLRHHSLDMVKFLIDNGADIYAKNNKGSTPMDFLSENEQKEIKEYLNEDLLTKCAQI